MASRKSPTKARPAPSAKLNKLLQKEKADSDVVLQEFPVFLSKTLMNQLYLIQYPQRPGNVSTEDMNIIETKIKPGQKKLQLSIGMDPESELYDPETAELLAELAEGIGLDEDKYMPDRRVRLEKTTMESINVPKLADISRYAIGVVRRGQVTLTPITSIVQMKTVYPYLNKADKAKVAFQKEKPGADTEDEEEEATKVTVKFSRNTAAQGDKNSTVTPSTSRASSYLTRKKEEEEAWIDLEYFTCDSYEFEKLYNSKPNSPFYVLDKKEYLEGLFPKYVETCIDSGSIGGGTSATEGGTAQRKTANPRISIQQMRHMPIPEQLRVLLTNAKVLQYYQIVDFLRSKLQSEFDDTSLVRSIQTVGVLVQGCWVVKSDVLYPEDFKSGANGISGAIMQWGRDAILGQFTEHRFVKRLSMISLTKLPSEEVTEILQQVSVMVPKKGWEFMLPYDTNFLGRFPEVVERQSLIWQMKKQQRVRHSSSSGGDQPGSSSPPGSRRRSRNKSISSSGDESGDDLHGGRRRRQSDSGGGGGGTSGGRGGGGRRQRRTSTRSEVGIPSRVET